MTNQVNHNGSILQKPVTEINLLALKSQRLASHYDTAAWSGCRGGNASFRIDYDLTKDDCERIRDAHRANAEFLEAVAAFDPAAGIIDVWENVRESGDDVLAFTEDYQSWLEEFHAQEQHAIAQAGVDHAEFWNAAAGVAHD